MLEGQYLSVFTDKRKVDWPIVLLPREKPYNTITQKSYSLWCIFILLSIYLMLELGGVVASDVNT